MNACDLLTEDEQLKVKQEFAERLNDNQVNLVCLHMIISAMTTIKSIINRAAKVKWQDNTPNLKYNVCLTHK